MKGIIGLAIILSLGFCFLAPSDKKERTESIDPCDKWNDSFEGKRISNNVRGLMENKIGFRVDGNGVHIHRVLWNEMEGYTAKKNFTQNVGTWYNCYMFRAKLSKADVYDINTGRKLASNGLFKFTIH